jgi:acyl-CoA synthetase (NDP forming)
MSLQDGEQIADCLTRLTTDVADLACFFLDVPRPDALGSDRDWYPAMEAMANVSATNGIPCAVAGILPEGLVPGLRKHLSDLGIAPLLGFSDAMEALAVAIRVGAAHRQKANAGMPGDLLTDHGDVGAAPGQLMLDEAESKSALMKYGLVTARFTTATPQQVVDKACAIGFPVALKLLSNEIAHKAKMGGVCLALDSQAALEAALDKIEQASLKYNGQSVERFLVEAMIDAPRAEYILGIKRQAALGFALLIGRGGVDAEKIGRYASVLLPLVDADLATAMESIGLTQSDPGYAAVCVAAHAIAAYALDNARRLQSLDVNPLIVDAVGNAIAADALIVISREN